MAGNKGRIDLTGGDFSLIVPQPFNSNVEDAHTGRTIPYEYATRNPNGPGWRDVRWLRYQVPLIEIGPPTPFIEDLTAEASERTF